MPIEHRSESQTLFHVPVDSSLAGLDLQEWSIMMQARTASATVK